MSAGASHGPFTELMPSQTLVPESEPDPSTTFFLENKTKAIDLKATFSYEDDENTTIQFDTDEDQTIEALIYDR